ncbi:copper oxidase, partial [Paraburkholderia sp. RL18-103-BIB-C]
EIVLMLHDFSFLSPDEILASLVGTSAASAHEMAQRMERAAAPTTRKIDSTDMSAMSTGDKSMGGMSMSHGAADLNDVSYDAFLANDRTLSDPEIVRVDKSGRVRLRIINGASSSQFWIDLGSLTGRVIAVDGHNVRPVAGKRFPIAMAQRLDILLDLPASGIFPILARLEGSAKQTGIVLATPGANIARIADEGDGMAPPVNNSLEARLSALESLTPASLTLFIGSCFPAP